MFGTKKRSTGVINTLVGDGTRIKGDLHFEGGCHIDGVIHGNVIAADKDAEAFLTISEEGFVDGSVRVPHVSLNGKVQGDVFASEAVTLGATAKVVGNVHYDLLEMTSGAEINGKLIHESAPAPAKQPAKPRENGQEASPSTPASPASRVEPVKQS
jgi:cytoskeletal protein CcmA (bactofilin family)